jgi:hypothetical protein
MAGMAGAVPTTSTRKFGRFLEYVSSRVSQGTSYDSLDGLVPGQESVPLLVKSFNSKRSNLDRIVATAFILRRGD